MNSLCEKITGNVKKVIIGQDRPVKLILTSLLAGGHVLMEDLPGTGKTVMAKSISASINAEFNRIQFTPDLLPSDVTGLNIYNQQKAEFEFKAGPAFCNILLADEINRAAPRTQSALLESMAERQITVDGVTRKLTRPYFVIATQNPIETLGTYPLPEAQLDRFLMRITMDSPTAEEEKAILSRFMKDEPLEDLQAVCGIEDIVKLMDEVKNVYIHSALVNYIVELSQKSRENSKLETGVSPRGTLALMNAARAYALIEGRDYVVPEDIKAVAVPVLAHRIVVKGGISSLKEQENIIAELLGTVSVPTENWVK